MHDLYRTVDFDDVPAITNKLKKFVKLDPAHVQDFDTKVLPLDFIRRIMPDFVSGLEHRFNDVLNMARLFYTPPTGTLDIHTDVREHRGEVYALNWPLYNYSNSAMTWYSGTAGTTHEHPDYGVLNHYDPADCTEIASTVITSPTIVRIDVPHAVTNSDTSSVRVILSFRFENDLRGWQ
jgi:hypothetical protein